MIYLDHNATTPLLTGVVESLQNVIRSPIGNPSSIHQRGQTTRAQLEEARKMVAHLVGAHFRDVTFTSGATEANHIAILGAARRSEARLRIVTTQVEHPSANGAAAIAHREGAELETLHVGPDGTVDLSRLPTLLDTPNPVLVSVIWVQNETGILTNIAEVSRIVRIHGGILHVDATQAVGKLDIDMVEQGIDLLTLSGHKIGAPKGVGALVARRHVDLDNLVQGGHQERGRRPGTENVLGILAFGRAAEIQAKRPYAEHMFALGHQLAEGLRGLGAQVVGDARATNSMHRIPSTVCAIFDGVPADAMLMGLDLEGVAASAGSACSSGSMEPSPVLLAMGIPKAEASCALRFSVGWNNTAEEIDAALVIIASQLAHIRSIDIETLRMSSDLGAFT